MSMAVCDNRWSFALDGVGGPRCGGVAFSLEDVTSPDRWLAQQEEIIHKETAAMKNGQNDIWASIQSSKKDDANLLAPYVHPLVRRSATSLSQKSLEICTESLGSETGSDGIFSSDDLQDYFSTCKTGPEEGLFEKTEEHDDMEPQDGEEEKEEFMEPPPRRRSELGSVNYHCSISRRSPPRSFPPPLPSICRRDGPCLSMRRHRRDGRLVVEAVPVPSQNYLHAQRHDGRLILTFIGTTFQDIYPESEDTVEVVPAETETEAEDGGPVESVAEDVDADNDVDVEDEILGDEEGEDEVEVVDKGIVVEVKVSRPPLPQNRGMKVQRSSVVINKFVGMPLSNQNQWTEKEGKAAVAGEQPAADVIPPTTSPPRLLKPRNSTTTTATAVVAVAAAASSSLSTDERYWRNAKGAQSAQRHPSPEKLFFTSKRLLNRQDLLHQVRRCSEHRRPLFIWEPCCIATS